MSNTNLNGGYTMYSQQPARVQIYCYGATRAPEIDCTGAAKSGGIEVEPQLEGLFKLYAQNLTQF